MTYDELMTAMQRATSEWNRRYADRIESAYPAGSDPHPGATHSDYAEHASLISAPAEYANLLEEKHIALLAEYNAPENAANRRRANG